MVEDDKAIIEFVRKEVLVREPKERDYLMRFEDEVMLRKLYPFFFQILDKDGTPLYISKDFQETGYESKGQVLANARTGKETREKTRSPKRRRP